MTVLWSRVKYKVDIYKLNVRLWLSGMWCIELSGARRWTRTREGARIWSQWENSYSLIPGVWTVLQNWCHVKVWGEPFFNSRSVTIVYRMPSGEGMCPRWAFWWGGSCLRAILCQGRWEPSSQYSQHLGDGCNGLVKGVGIGSIHLSGWRMRNGNWTKWECQAYLYVAWGQTFWRKDARKIQDISH